MQRKLRIAWSVVFGVLCLLLIVSWVRSNYRNDRARGVIRKDYLVEIASVQSSLGVLVKRTSSQPSTNWRFRSLPIDAGEELNLWAPPSTVPGELRLSAIGFFWYSVPRLNSVVVPHWFLVFLFTTFAVLPWIRQLKWRYSLRTLLIATTLVAVVLGILAISN
jgi:hypothetical protein